MREEIIKFRETEIEKKDKDLDKIISVEKGKRFKLEDSIRTRLEKVGVVVLERGAILATTDQMHVVFKICKETLEESEAKLRQGNDLIVCLKNEKSKTEEEKRSLAEFKKSEKRKRLSQEKRIEERLIRDGMVVLESGKL